MIKNVKIREKWSAGKPRDVKGIEEITLHATGGLHTLRWIENTDLRALIKQRNTTNNPDTQKALNREMNRARGWVDGIGLFHYLIERSGETNEIIDPMNYVYHSCSGEHDQKTIGVEFEKSKPNNSDEITAEQLVSGVKLIEELCLMFPGISRITTHRYNWSKFYNPYPKPCPGVFPEAVFQFEIDALTPRIGRRLEIFF